MKVEKLKVRKKLLELKFTESLFRFDKSFFVYKIPLGLGTALIYDIDENLLLIEKDNLMIPIFRIENIEEIQTIFDALVPEKNRLPFN
jgi:hypothetical protein